MPVSTRSKSLMTLKPVSKAEWNAVEALLFLKKTPASMNEPPKQQRPHRRSATYTPGTFAGMEE